MRLTTMRRAAVVLVAAALLVSPSCSSPDEHKAATSVERAPAADSLSPPTKGESLAGVLDEELVVHDPVRVRIPDIGVDALVVEVGLADDGSMETPKYDADQVGWYVEGPRPGESGPAVLVGHVDSPSGPDVFADLEDLEPGDEVVVRDKYGQDHIFVVESFEQVDKDDLPYGRIWGDTGEEPVLRLVTCAGDYVDEWTDNLIVYATARTPDD